MKENHDFNLDKMTSKSLKEKLRSIPKLKVPVTLRAKLFDTIPQKRTKKSSDCNLKHRFGILSFPASAAAAMILLFIIVLSYSPSTPSYNSDIDFNNISNNTPNDLNESFIDDSNYVNNRLLRLNIEIPDYSQTRAGLIFQK